MCSKLWCSIGTMVAFNHSILFCPWRIVNQVNEVAPKVLKMPLHSLWGSVELAPSWRLRTGRLCFTSTCHTPDEERETVTGEGHRAPAKPRKYIPNHINDKDRKSAGLFSSSSSFTKREAAHSFRFPCGAVPTHSKPGQTKAPVWCPLAFSWCFALLLENIHKIYSKPGVVSVMTCLDVSAPVTNQLSQQTPLSWHSVTGSPTLWSQLN